MLKMIFALGVLALVFSSCGDRNDDVISTVPGTNNPNMIVDSNRNNFLPGNMGMSH